MRFCSIAIGLLFAAIAPRHALAADASPATAPTRLSATTRAAGAAADDAALERSKAKFLSAVTEAHRQYLHDLNAIFSAAMKAENLDRANTARDAIRDAEDGWDDDPASSARLRKPTTRRGGTKVTVRAHDDWQRGIEVKKGDMLEMTATGTWCLNVRARDEHTLGPDGLRRNGAISPWTLYGSLVARIGPRLYFVGRHLTIRAESDGLLEFRSNDFNPDDNDGALTVTIFKD
jgi:hypothetical protein